jgi:hypothetical protein
MMAGPFALMQTISAKLRADANLNAWLQAKFSRALTVFVGVDDDEQPTAANCPILAMRPGGYAPSADRSHRLISVQMAIVIATATNAKTITGTETAMDGLDLLEEFYSRVESALSDWISDNYHEQAIYGDSQTEIAFPLFRASWGMTFQEEI